MEDLQPGQLARAIVALTEWANENATPEDDNALVKRLAEHLRSDVTGLPVVSRGLPGYQRANFQVAIDAYLARPGRSAELIGLPMTRGYRFGLAELVSNGDRYDRHGYRSRADRVRAGADRRAHDHLCGLRGVADRQ